MFRCFLCVWFKILRLTGCSTFALPLEAALFLRQPFDLLTPSTLCQSFAFSSKTEIVLACVLPHFDLEFSSHGKSDYQFAFYAFHGYNPAKGWCLFDNLVMEAVMKSFTEVIAQLMREGKRVGSYTLTKHKAFITVWTVTNNMSTISMLSMPGCILDPSCEYKQWIIKETAYSWWNIKKIKEQPIFFMYWFTFWGDFSFSL